VYEYKCTCVRACVCVCAQHVQYFMVSLTGKMGAKQTDTENRKEHKWYTEKNSYFCLKIPPSVYIDFKLLKGNSNVFVW